MSTAPGRIMGKPSAKALRTRLSGRVADKPVTDDPGYNKTAALAGSDTPSTRKTVPDEGFCWREGKRST
jgi:hypothetical protein